MITPEEFLARWPGKKFVKVSSEAIRTLAISDEAKSFLCLAGLPEKPGLDITIDFPVSHIPTLPEALQKQMELPEGLKRYRRIGVNFVGLQICIDEAESGCVVAVNLQKSKRTFMNSGIVEFAEFSLIYRELQEFESLDDVDEESFDSATDKLEAQLKSIDPRAMSDEDYWWMQLIEIRRSGYM